MLRRIRGIRGFRNWNHYKPLISSTSGFNSGSYTENTPRPRGKNKILFNSLNDISLIDHQYINLLLPSFLTLNLIFEPAESPL